MKKVKLEVKNITKRFGDLLAVNNVSFEVYEGETFTLLGPSGCGKTTTLRIIAGLEKPDKGRVFIGGRDVTDVPPRERNVCLVFQEYAVFPHMTVYDNIAFGLKARKEPEELIARRVREVAELLGLTSVLNTKASKVGLSEKQRIALGRCLVVEPEILLLDEPLTLADAKIRETMRRELRRLQRELKITMIYVTHDQLEAMMLSDRIAVMNAGRLLQVGTPREIYEKPKNLFVAYFIGSPTINLIEGKLVRKDGKLVLEKEGLVLDATKLLEEAKGVGKIIGREIVIGIRPEDIQIDPSGHGVWKGEVELFEVSGDQLIVHIKLAEETKIRAMAPFSLRLRTGDIVGVAINPDKVHVFDRKTGERIDLLSIGEA